VLAAGKETASRVPRLVSTKAVAASSPAAIIRFFSPCRTDGRTDGRGGPEERGGEAEGTILLPRNGRFLSPGRREGGRNTGGQRTSPHTPQSHASTDTCAGWVEHLPVTTQT
jgi:hypothetical protein